MAAPSSTDSGHLARERAGETVSILTLVRSSDERLRPAGRSAKRLSRRSRSGRRLPCGHRWLAPREEPRAHGRGALRAVDGAATLRRRAPRSGPSEQLAVIDYRALLR